MKNSHQGFGLIEMLVGVAIGLLGLLAVAQVVVTFNQHRTTAAQVLEAQGNGAMALYLLERDVDQAGFGMFNIQGCSVIQWCKSATGGGSCALQTALSTQPVTITDGGASSDEVSVQYAKSSSGSPGSTISADQTAYSDAFKVSTTAGYVLGDIVVSDVADKCTMGQVTNVINNEDGNGYRLEHALTGSEFYNATAAVGGADGWQVARAKDLLVNLGTFVSKDYTVSSNSLVLKAFPDFTASNIVDGIVFMKAQYGLDTNSDGAVDEWRCGAPTCAAVTNTAQIIALRIGIVSRSPLYEKETVDTASTVTVLPAVTGITGGTAVTYNLPDTHYRYKTYYTILPLRNAIWAN
ncbi:MAG TPA: PilW family protein [Methylophilaceae bacterium]|jgi:type IV pilus assembly protein PilW